MKASSSWGTRILGCVWALFAIAILAGCTGGKDGAPGPAGATGPGGATGGTGGTGPVLALDISTAKTVTAKVTSVTSGTAPVVTVTLVDESGNPLKGLAAGEVRLAIAQLQAAPAGGTTQWANYLTSVEKATPTTTGWGTADAVQATAEVASSGTFTDKGDGSYAYSFSKPLDALGAAATAAYAVAGRIPAPLTIAYDGTLTHRVGLEIRGAFGGRVLPTPTNNAVYDYLPSTGATVVTTTRRISSNKECDACHAKLEVHGGPRIDVEYCVMCHNPGTADAQSGNTLDMKVLAHKVHAGSSLPSVQADTASPKGSVPGPGIGYVIYGYGGSVNNFNSVVWPQDTRNCTTCHNTADTTNTPDAGNFATVATAAACGGCHDKINFTTGAGHTSGTAPIADTTCMNSNCHAAATPGVAAVGGGKVDIVTAHNIAVQSTMAKYKLNITRVEAVMPNATVGQPDVVESACAAKVAAAAAGATVICTVLPGYYPRVSVTVTDPTNGNARYDLTAAPFNTYKTSISARAGWSTLNYTNPGAIVGSGTTQAESVSFLANCDGVGVNNLCIASTKQAIPAPWTALPGTLAVNTASSVIPAVPAVIVSPDNTMLTARFPYPVPLASERALAGGSGAIGAQASLNIVGLADVGTTAPKVSGSSPAVYATSVTIRSADPAYFPINDTSAVARRVVVDENSCLRCHKKLVFHGSRVNTVQYCVICHNPAQAPRVQANGAAAGSSGSEPVDLKFFIHGIHAATYKAGVLDLSGIGFPGKLSNCLGCHKTDTYYPVDPTAVFATTVDPGQTYSTTRFQGYDDPTKHYAITANAAACGSCHTAATAQTHMKQQGAVVVGDLIDNSAAPAANVGMLGLGYGTANTFVAGAPHIKAIDGSTLPQYRTETCSICHGPGATADVKVVHSVTSYKYN